MKSTLEDVEQTSFAKSSSAKKEKTTKHYVNNDLLRFELIKSKQHQTLTKFAVEMLLCMVDNIQSSFVYKNYADKEDCKSSAVEVILRNWDQYDATRHNPFAFFTRMIYNGLFAGWNHLNEKNKQTISISAIFKENI